MKNSIPGMMPRPALPEVGGNQAKGKGERVICTKDTGMAQWGMHGGSSSEIKGLISHAKKSYYCPALTGPHFLCCSP